MKNAPLTGKVKQGAEINRQHNNNITSDDLLDTAAPAQRKRLLQFLIDNGSVNTLFARDRLNIMAPAPRIKELREQGHKINTDRIVINDMDGRPHYQVARYVLLQLAEVTP